MGNTREWIKTVKSGGVQEKLNYRVWEFSFQHFYLTIFMSFTFSRAIEFLFQLLKRLQVSMIINICPMINELMHFAHIGPIIFLKLFSDNRQPTISLVVVVVMVVRTYFFLASDYLRSWLLNHPKKLDLPFRSMSTPQSER